jgi:CheY-like chemotaxis protein
VRASDGHEACELLAAGVVPDVLVTDVDMAPMDGSS